MKKVFVSAAVVAVLGIPALSHAGYTAATNIFSVTNTSTLGSAGNTFSVSAPASFFFYLPDTSADPQISGGDLNQFRFSFTGTTALGGPVAAYAGTYRISYAFNDISVSTGAFALTATELGTSLATLSGSLTQDVNGGPGNPAFADLGKTYNYNPVALTGNYVVDGTHTASVQLGLRQNGQPVPEPASLAALGLGAVGLLRRRRKA